MPEIPDYQSLMLPLLKLSANGSISLRDAVQKLVEEFQLSAEQMVRKLPSGQAIIYNRTGWAKTELVKAGLVEQPRRGSFNITNRGRALLDERPHRSVQSLAIANSLTRMQVRRFHLSQPLKHPANALISPSPRSRPSFETSWSTASSPSRINIGARSSSSS